MGYRPIIVNNNPETVSTDFDTGDGLYFEPVALVDVQRILRHENPLGVVVQFGGQTAINLAEPLVRRGIDTLVERLGLLIGRELDDLTRD